MFDNKYVWSMRFIFLSFMLAETSADQFYTNTRYNKRDDIGPGSSGIGRFHTGSRYGRSQGQVEVTARNDRFFMGTRYGKRDPGLEPTQSGEAVTPNNRYGRSPGQVEVSARNDRFFLGSRYGKRMDDSLPLGKGESEGNNPQVMNPGVNIPEGSSDIPVTLMDETKHMTCTYTGVVNLYQCFSSF